VAFFKGLKSGLDKDACAVLIMKEMGWSYREYHETPMRVIQDVVSVLNAQNETKSVNQNSQQTISDLPPGDNGPTTLRRK
jgi:hypothetical protein